ncbi:rhomboid family intramembrane serine protease [Halapricum hydrolyticum]|uniref:Rhomboid family intramembrane serine protease n=1 Tax=Halapricum hydrolyticum TaxID=2979991 RepID=A0AAE3ICF5_9EURY|nr:rhomboid family intramembrane serine protease [Halapricum hydrolyticum]MCU4718687.1 rhomboid family intramembrane serine protease [Halapricum hydrolyticum]MCU4727627.1 rhomboid family intramembrane serine protease [Halapricum hydrolyticum]
MVSLSVAALLVTLAVAVGAVSYYDGWQRWRGLTDGRLVYGVPWGTLIAVALVTAFYLLAQGGLAHWDDPLTLPFVSWSYFYPFGVVTSGFAHGSPAHLVSNMTGTLAFGLVAEYAWGHYPPSRRERDSLLATDGSWRYRPGVRIALVPAAMFAVALLTGIFSLGPGLGFSGAVFAVAGFAVVLNPWAAVGAVVGSRALDTLYQAFVNPVVTGSISPSGPSPPSWASIAFQAHMLGFVVGAVVAIGLLRSRRRRLSPSTLFLGTVGFGLALSLWLLVWPGEDVFYLYRAAGVVVVLVLAGLVTVAVAGSDRSIPRPLAIGWLLLLALPFALFVGVLALSLVVSISGLVPEIAGLAPIIALVVLAVVILAAPAVPAAVWGRDTRWATHRNVALLALGTVGLLLIVPGLLYGPITVDAGSVTDTGEVTVGDYLVTYEENVTGGQTLVLLDVENATDVTHDGLIVASESRSIWTIAERKPSVAFDGEASVNVGGLGWRETVRAERTGWDVTGNESAYAVDLTVDGETTRSFTTDPVQADVRVDDHRVAVVPTDDGFGVRVTRDNATVGTVAIPEAGETATVGPLTIRTEDDRGSTAVVVASDGTSVTVAEKETYD